MHSPRRHAPPGRGSLSVQPEVDLLEATGNAIPGVALLGYLASTRAEGDAARLVVEQLDQRIGERLVMLGWNEDPGIRARDLVVSGNVGRDDGRRTGEGARQHHPEALAAERGRHEQL